MNPTYYCQEHMLAEHWLSLARRYILLFKYVVSLKSSCMNGKKRLIIFKKIKKKCWFISCIRSGMEYNGYCELRSGQTARACRLKKNVIGETEKKI